MWLILTAVVVFIGLAVFYRLKISHHKENRSGSNDVYICPSCGNQHCNCYKRKKE